MNEFQQLGAGWTTGEAVALLTFQLLGPLFWWWQNRKPGRVGGPISLVKAQWFVFAVSLWVVAPLLASGNTEARMICLILAVSMSLRGVVELYLCLVTRRWKVRYGLFHDAFHLALALGGLAWLARLGEPTWAFFLLTITITTLVTEIIFVRWFRNSTAGPEEAVYFVSGSPEHRDVNHRTAWLFLPQFSLFLVSLLGVLLGRGVVVS
jgi:hypothetical protein